MDFFKFISDGQATELDQGEQINGIDSAMWVERYLDPGEFTFEAKLSSGLKEFLPLGTIISHTNTLELAIVENQEIDEKDDDDSLIKITGRTFSSILEKRVVGVNLARTTSLIGQYVAPANYPWIQAVNLINEHIDNGTYTNDHIEDVVGLHVIPGTSVSVERAIDIGNVLDKVIELLKIDDLGIKTIRKNTFGVGSSTDTQLIIHGGVDHSDDVLFTWQGGDISSIKYLFSNKSEYTSALVMGRYIWKMVDLAPTKYDRRIMVIDASDIDGFLDAVPTGLLLAVTEGYLTARGNQILSGQKKFTITQANLSNNSKFQYRRDYNIGDLVSIGGSFGQKEVMRVVEYAEIKDDNGESGHPTLQIIGA